MKCFYSLVALLVFNITKAQINFNFENWTGNNPNGWATFNSVPGVPQTTFKESVSPFNGLYSVKLKTATCPSCANFFLSDPLPGLISLGNSSEAEGIPYTLRPLSVNFKYKANPMNNDEGGIFVQLTKWNNATQESEIIGEANFFVANQQNNWTAVSLPVTYYSSAIPDTLIITALSSLGHSLFQIPGIPTPVAGSELYIDDLNIVPPSCSGFNINVTGTNETGILTADGTASVNASGGTSPYTYQWSNASTASSINNLNPGLYQVTVSDVNGCTKTGNYNVLKGNCTIALSVSGTQATSPGANNGNAQVTVTGGTPPYTYEWNTGDQTASVTGLDVGVYFVLVVDATGTCAQFGYFPNVTVPNSLNDNSKVDAVLVYPTLVNKELTVSLLNLESELNYEIKNTLGQIIEVGKLDNSKNILDLSTLMSGMYYFKLFNSDYSNVVRIIKE